METFFSPVNSISASYRDCVFLFLAILLLRNSNFEPLNLCYNFSSSCFGADSYYPSKIRSFLLFLSILLRNSNLETLILPYNFSSSCFWADSYYPSKIRSFLLFLSILLRKS